ncbi:MAG TPA: hypothetical protein VJZ71_16815 [Phycisphaerae bacterium]|nr:hypothetical protein [Phycisphaerae bacterium]
MITTTELQPAADNPNIIRARPQREKWVALVAFMGAIASLALLVWSCYHATDVDASWSETSLLTAQAWDAGVTICFARLDPHKNSKSGAIKVNGFSYIQDIELALAEVRKQRRRKAKFEEAVARSKQTPDPFDDQFAIVDFKDAEFEIRAWLRHIDALRQGGIRYANRIAVNRSTLGFYFNHNEPPIGVTVLRFPLALLVVLFGIFPSLWFIRRRRHHLWRTARHCRKCGYNLTGNTTGRCPECGHATPEAAP